MINIEELRQALRDYFGTSDLSFTIGSLGAIDSMTPDEVIDTAIRCGLLRNY